MHTVIQGNRRFPTEEALYEELVRMHHEDLEVGALICYVGREGEVPKLSAAVLREVLQFKGAGFDQLSQLVSHLKKFGIQSGFGWGKLASGGETLSYFGDKVSAEMLQLALDELMK